MKKRFIIAIITIGVLLSACSKKTIPSDIVVDGKTIHYNDSKDTIEEILGEGEEDGGECLKWLGGFSYNDKIDIYYTNNIARSFKVRDNSFKTYNGFSVGDDISKVKDTYKYETDSRCKCYVMFDGDNEIDQTKDNDKSDDLLWIVYSYNDDGSIEEILINDYLFGIELR